MKEPYQYSGLEAELYDELDELSDFDDVDFYLWHAQLAQDPVLDLGCGTGRLLLPLARAGRAMVGLDASREMLAQCRERIEAEGLMASACEGDMRRFELGEGRFGMIVIPGYSLQMLLELEEQRETLECCFRHLREGGRLIFPIYMPWDMIWDEEDEMPLRERKRVEVAERCEVLVAQQGWEIKADQQLLALKNRYERWSETGSLLEAEDRTMRIRWDMPHDLLSRLQEVGFGEVELYGDYSQEPPMEDSETIVYVARKS